MPHSPVYMHIHIVHPHVSASGTVWSSVFWGHWTGGAEDRTPTSKLADQLVESKMSSSYLKYLHAST